MAFRSAPTGGSSPAAASTGRCGCGNLGAVDRWPPWRVIPARSTAWPSAPTVGPWPAAGSMGRCGCGKLAAGAPWRPPAGPTGAAPGRAIDVDGLRTARPSRPTWRTRTSLWRRTADGQMLRHITALEFDSEHMKEALEGSRSAWHTRSLLGKAITTGQVAAFLVEGGTVAG